MDWRQTREAAKFWNNPANLEIIYNAEAVVPPYERILGTKLGTDRKVKSGGPLENLGEQLRTDGQNRLKPVDPAHLNKYPYQSVGKIYVRSITTRKVAISTAFFVGNDMIITAAHVFDKIEGVVVFVPASLNSTDKDGRKYGHYYISRCPQIHPRYGESLAELRAIDEELKTCDDSKKWELDTRKKVLKQQTNYYDICTAKIIGGYHQGEQARLVAPGSPLNPEVKNVELHPIKVECPPSFTGNNYFPGTIIGYGSRPMGNGTSLASEGRMLELTGFFMPETNTNNESMEMVPAAWYGMSGGPWIFGHEMNSGSAAIGVQSMSTEESSYSPYFTDELLGEVGYHTDA